MTKSYGFARLLVVAVTWVSMCAVGCGTTADDETAQGVSERSSEVLTVPFHVPPGLAKIPPGLAKIPPGLAKTPLNFPPPFQPPFFHPPFPFHPPLQPPVAEPPAPPATNPAPEPAPVNNPAPEPVPVNNPAPEPVPVNNPAPPPTPAPVPAPTTAPTPVSAPLAPNATGLPLATTAIAAGPGTVIFGCICGATQLLSHHSTLVSQFVCSGLTAASQCLEAALTGAGCTNTPPPGESLDCTAACNAAGKAGTPAVTLTSCF
jgi:hypothetical protein